MFISNDSAETHHRSVAVPRWQATPLRFDTGLAWLVLYSYQASQFNS